MEESTQWTRLEGSEAAVSGAVARQRPQAAQATAAGLAPRPRRPAMRLLFDDYHEAPSRTIQGRLTVEGGSEPVVTRMRLPVHRPLAHCAGHRYHIFVAGARLSRDLQMVNLVLRIEHGALLTFAAITGEPLLLAPWLAVESGTLLVGGLSLAHSAGQQAFSGKPIELRLHWGPTCNLLWRLFGLIQVVCLMAKQMHWC
ncbi:Protein of unknown function [Gryllus bimaculatus]|nr:Protein of unknown function [Gryllus bimaculatus]